MIELLSPFTMVQRRSLAQGDDSLLTGRWAMQDNTGRAVVPGAAAKFGLYLILEGELLHTGSNVEFGAGPTFLSTRFERHPTVGAVGECALAYGIFRFRVGPEGFDPLDNYVVGNYVEVDDAGRLVPFAAGAAPRAARIEAVETNAAGFTQLTCLALGA